MSEKQAPDAARRERGLVRVVVWLSEEDTEYLNAGARIHGNRSAAIRQLIEDHRNSPVSEGPVSE